jgi:hypothetical protein
LLLLVGACLLLFSPSWVLQASAAVSSTIQTVDASGRMGSYNCLALDSKGNPGISYYDSTNYHLKYAHWNGASWAVQTVDADFMTGLHTALAFDANDNPHISYDGQSALRYAYWNGSAWDIQTLDVAGSFTSIAIDANGYPRISYFSVQNGADLKYAVWNGSSWSIQTIDSEGLVGEFTSLKLDSGGYAHISYFDITNRALKVAWQDTSGWHIQVVDSSSVVGLYSSLDLDANGNTHIAYFDNASRDLKYARSDGSNWNVTVVDSSGDVGTDTSLALDSHGNPHISYTDNTNHVLKYASWNGSAWNIMSLNSAGYVGEYTSLPNDQTCLKINKDDVACIAYCDWGSYWLKYLTAPDPTVSETKYVQPIASLSVSSNPVVIGQLVNFNLSLVPRPPSYNDRFSNITLRITNPDGTTINLGPFFADQNGFVSTLYVPTQVGSYSIQAKYSGQWFPLTNATYWPAQSNIVTLNVLQQLPPSPTPTPPPTPAPTSTPSTIPTQQSTSQPQSPQISNNSPPQQNLQPENPAGTVQPQYPQSNGEQGSFSIEEVVEGLVIGLVVCGAVLVLVKKVSG